MRENNMINTSTSPNTNNIYNTNNINKSNTIIVLDDDVNIYYIYNTIRQQIYSINKSIDKLKKRLDILIKGPQDVQAQQYDNVIRSSLKAEDINSLFREIKEVNDEIKIKESELATKNKYRQEMEELFKELLDLRPRNLELIVLYRHHVKGESLKKITKVLRRFNSYGEKVRYSYQHIRRINSQIIAKMANKTEENCKNATF